MQKICEFEKNGKNGEQELYNVDIDSRLLRDAIKAIVNQEEKDGLASIFKNGSDALYADNISGLDDFELISFVVVK